MLKDNICKNCGYYVANEKFCGQCGQSTNTHRLTWKHFISHDIVHGLFHFEGLVPKTIWSIIKNPAKVAIEYIGGKRKSYYSFFYLLMILIGVYLLIRPNIAKEDLEMFDESGTVILTGILYKNTKLIIFSLVPVFAFSGFLLFRKPKYNFVEHNVIAVCCLIGSYILYLVFTIFNKIPFLNELEWESFWGYLLNGVAMILILSALFYPLYSYFKFGILVKYSLLGSLWRTICFFLLVFILLVSLLVGIASFVKGEFVSEVNMSF